MPRLTIEDNDVLTLLFLLVLALVVAAGSLLARRRLSRQGATWKRSGLEGSLIGVYGLLLSFGFFLSGNVNRERTALVHDQSEALAMLYREADLLPPADAAVVRESVREILRLEVRVSGVDDDGRAEIEARSAEAYDALWKSLSARAQSTGPIDVYRPALEFVQRATSLEYRLRFADTERAPLAFLVLLLLGALLVGFLIGFTSGGEGHGVMVPLLYVLLAGCTIAAILDLNDPWNGFLRPSVQNYEQLLHAIGGS